MWQESDRKDIQPISPDRNCHNFSHSLPCEALSNCKSLGRIGMERDYC
ncbi:hypothetical protein CIPAW_11G077000 [Carya illinoinensis]|uniref:Uncharacterized protein n=1 Tax=Carya illinoinensis TaxID=32201 RepID=A0A8T1NUT8_CARIL|nr:hypothetical protein CIPAW_11G077000 [Carya illinoinensis]